MLLKVGAVSLRIDYKGIAFIFFIRLFPQISLCSLGGTQDPPASAFPVTQIRLHPLMDVIPTSHEVAFIHT